MQDCKYNYFDRKRYDYKSKRLIADTFNNYIADITKILKLKKYPNFDGQSLFNITESVIKIKKTILLKRTHFHLLYFQKRTLLKR